MKNLKKEYKGSVTIFLSLTITLILSVIFVLIESARLVSLRTYFTDVSYLSMDSLFGNYCKELWQDYGLLSINTSDVDIEDCLSQYISDNISTSTLIDVFDDNYNLLKGNLKEITTSNHTYLTDNSGEIFAKQIQAYMKYASIDNATKLFENYFKKDKLEVKNYLNPDSTPHPDTLEKYNVEHIPDTSECLDVSTSEANDYHDSLSELITHHLQHNTLLLLVDDPLSISTVHIDNATLPSVTYLSDETIFIAEGYLESSEVYSVNKVILEEYISTHFGCYTNINPKSKLKYELEYVLMGRSDDDKNLLSTAAHLIILRSSFNSMYILSDAKKYTAAHDLATKCIGWMNVPLLTLLTKYSIISLWATAESFLDVKDLLSEKKVPLIKDDSTWTLSLDDASSLSKNTVSKNDGTDGLSYIDYIKVLLIAESDLALRYRTMDLIQLNMRHNYNETFSLRKCLCSVDTEIKYTAKNIFLNTSGIVPTRSNSLFKINLQYNYD